MSNSCTLLLLLARSCCVSMLLLCLASSASNATTTLSATTTTTTTISPDHFTIASVNAHRPQPSSTRLGSKEGADTDKRYPLSFANRAKTRRHKRVPLEKLTAADCLSGPQGLPTTTQSRGAANGAQGAANVQAVLVSHQGGPWRCEYNFTISLPDAQHLIQLNLSTFQSSRADMLNSSSAQHTELQQQEKINIINRNNNFNSTGHSTTTHNNNNSNSATTTATTSSGTNNNSYNNHQPSLNLAEKRNGENSNNNNDVVVKKHLHHGSKAQYHQHGKKGSSNSNASFSEHATTVLLVNKTKNVNSSSSPFEKIISFGEHNVEGVASENNRKSRLLKNKNSTSKVDIFPRGEDYCTSKLIIEDRVGDGSQDSPAKPLVLCLESADSSWVHYYQSDLTVTLLWNPHTFTPFSLAYRTLPSEGIPCTFHCGGKSRLCLLDSQLCDGHEDCADGSDEDWQQCMVSTHPYQAQASDDKSHMVIIGVSVGVFIVVLLVVPAVLMIQFKCRASLRAQQDSLLQQQQRAHSLSSEMYQSPSGSVQENGIQQYEQRASLLQEQHQPLQDQQQQPDTAARTQHPSSRQFSLPTSAMEKSLHCTTFPFSSLPERSLLHPQSMSADTISQPSPSAVANRRYERELRHQSYPHHVARSADGEEGYPAAQRALHAQNQFLMQQHIFRPPPNKTIYDRDSPPPPYALSQGTKSLDSVLSANKRIRNFPLPRTGGHVGGETGGYNNKTKSKSPQISPQQVPRCHSMSSPRPNSIQPDRGCFPSPTTSPPPDYHQIASDYAAPNVPLLMAAGDSSNSPALGQTAMTIVVCSNTTLAVPGKPDYFSCVDSTSKSARGSRSNMTYPTPQTNSTVRTHPQVTSNTLQSDVCHIHSTPTTQRIQSPPPSSNNTPSHKSSNVNCPTQQHTTNCPSSFTPYSQPQPINPPNPQSRVPRLHPSSGACSFPSETADSSVFVFTQSSPSIYPCPPNHVVSFPSTTTSPISSSSIQTQGTVLCGDTKQKEDNNSNKSFTQPCSSLAALSPSPVSWCSLASTPCTHPSSLLSKPSSQAPPPSHSYASNSLFIANSAGTVAEMPTFSESPHVGNRGALESGPPPLPSCCNQSENQCNRKNIYSSSKNSGNNNSGQNNFTNDGISGGGNSDIIPGPALYDNSSSARLPAVVCCGACFSRDVQSSCHCHLAASHVLELPSGQALVSSPVTTATQSTQQQQYPHHHHHHHHYHHYHHPLPAASPPRLCQEQHQHHHHHHHPHYPTPPPSSACHPAQGCHNIITTGSDCHQPNLLVLCPSSSHPRPFSSISSSSSLTPSPSPSSPNAHSPMVVDNTFTTADNNSKDNNSNKSACPEFNNKSEYSNGNLVFRGAVVHKPVTSLEALVDSNGNAAAITTATTRGGQGGSQHLRDNIDMLTSLPPILGGSGSAVETNICTTTSSTNNCVCLSSSDPSDTFCDDDPSRSPSRTGTLMLPGQMALADPVDNGNRLQSTGDIITPPLEKAKEHKV